MARKKTSKTKTQTASKPKIKRISKNNVKNSK